MIALRDGKITAANVNIGSRVKHLTGIGDQCDQTSYVFLQVAWTYPAFDDVACAFPLPIMPELLLPKLSALPFEP